MQITVRPVPSARWHGKAGKDSFAMNHTIEALVDTQTGRYATGMTEEEAATLGASLGLDLSDKYNPLEAHPFWGSTAGKVSLPNHTLVLDDTRPLDLVKIKVLKASRFCANSLKEFEESKWPDATHYIQDEEEEAEGKANKVQRKARLIAATMDMTLDEKTNIVRLLSTKTVTGKSANFIDVELYGILDDDKNWDRFATFMKMDKAEVTLRAKLTEALAKNVLTKDGLSISFMGDVIAADFESTVTYFQDPNNQATKIFILEKLEAAK